MEKRRSDTTTINRAGQVEHWMICSGGPLLAKVESVKCADSKVRSANVYGQKTLTSMSASVRVNNKTITGSIYEIDGIWHFTGNSLDKNNSLLPSWSKRQKGINTPK